MGPLVVWGHVNTGNGNGVWRKVILAALLPTAGFLVGYGDLKSDVKHVEQRMAEEIPRAAQTHDAIEARTDQKISQVERLILIQLQEINARLARLERRP